VGFFECDNEYLFSIRGENSFSVLSKVLAFQGLNSMQLIFFFSCCIKGDETDVTINTCGKMRKTKPRTFSVV
jgi:hypothetical protein